MKKLMVRIFLTCSPFSKGVFCSHAYSRQIQFAKCHIEWARKNLETWEEAKGEVYCRGSIRIRRRAASSAGIRAILRGAASSATGPAFPITFRLSDRIYGSRSCRPTGTRRRPIVLGMPTTARSLRSGTCSPHFALAGCRRRRRRRITAWNTPSASRSSATAA